MPQWGWFCLLGCKKQTAGPSTPLFAKCANNFAQDDNLFMSATVDYEELMVVG
jgi:hypothetical protein